MLTLFLNLLFIKQINNIALIIDLFFLKLQKGSPFLLKLYILIEMSTLSALYCFIVLFCSLLAICKVTELVLELQNKFLEMCNNQYFK